MRTAIAELPQSEAERTRGLLGNATLALIVSLVAMLGVVLFGLRLAANVSVLGILLVVVFGVAAAVAQFVHWYLLGAAAHALGRSAVAWVTLAVVLFSAGSVIALLALRARLNEAEVRSG